MIPSRLAGLDRELAAAGLAGIVLNAGPSLTYFTGLDFHLMERPVVLVYVIGRMPIFILPRLEAAKVAEIGQVKIYFYDEDPDRWPKIFADALADSGAAGGTLGVEPLQLRVLEYTLLRQAVENIHLADGSQVTASLRSIKDAAEIKLMQQAVDIAQDALKAVLPLMRRGMTEEEVAGELIVQLFRHGSDAVLPFSPIVSSGANGANPHARPSKRSLSEGDLLVIDWGASCRGYVSDLTRTFAIGEIDEECARIHDIVQQANSAGRAAGKTGVACGEVDRAARSVIEKAGYGAFFTHRTGHGIGMQCHEEPYMRTGNKQILREGMTYTVEPGIYLPGRNGVRIEDDVLITAEGPVSMSSLPRRIIRVC